MKHTLIDFDHKAKDFEITLSPLGISIGPFFIFYENGDLHCQVNDDVNVWMGDLVDPLTTKYYTLIQDHPDACFTLSKLEVS